MVTVSVISDRIRHGTMCPNWIDSTRCSWTLNMCLWSAKVYGSDRNDRNRLTLSGIRPRYVTRQAMWSIRPHWRSSNGKRSFHHCRRNDHKIRENLQNFDRRRLYSERCSIEEWSMIFNLNIEQSLNELSSRSLSHTDIEPSDGIEQTDADKDTHPDPEQ